LYFKHLAPRKCQRRNASSILVQSRHTDTESATDTISGIADDDGFESEILGLLAALMRILLARAGKRRESTLAHLNSNLA
jgi:hypothetical protein